ncbi:MAG: hypothetical protein ACI9W2_005373 [Gammaproteobacteria bacterium]|jgi:hypothetical protein
MDDPPPPPPPAGRAGAGTTELGAVGAAPTGAGPAAGAGSASGSNDPGSVGAESAAPDSGGAANAISAAGALPAALDSPAGALCGFRSGSNVEPIGRVTSACRAPARVNKGCGYFSDANVARGIRKRRMCIAKRSWRARYIERPDMTHTPP